MRSDFKRNSRDDQRETQSASSRIKEEKDKKSLLLNDIRRIKGQKLDCYVYDGFSSSYVLFINDKKRIEWDGESK